MHSHDSLGFSFSENHTCRPPRVNVHLNKTIADATVILPSQWKTLIRTDVTNECNTSDENLTCEWQQGKVYLNEDMIGSLAPSPMRKGGWFPLALFTSFYGGGYYLLRCVVRVRNRKGAVAYDFGIVHFVNPKPVAEIQGVETALWKAKSVILSASDSYDSTVQNLGSKWLKFAWSCRREDQVKFINVNMRGGCFGSGSEILTWRSKELIINTTGMEPDRTYEFKVTVKKWIKYRTSAVHTLRVEKLVSIV